MQNLREKISQLFCFKNKKAIVTGASGSIGFAAAEVLAALGAELVLAGRNEQKLAAAQQKLEQALGSSVEGKLRYDCCDFSKLPALEELFQTHQDADILVNSIGINIPQSLLEVSEENYDTTIDSNLKSAFFQTKFFVKARRQYCQQGQQDPENQSSSLIHISSQMGLVGGDQRSVYCASKHALQGMCKAVALEIGQWNMRINTICPTFIANEFTTTTLSDPALRERIYDSIVFRRLGQTDDLYGAIAYLASDASKLVTGTALAVDGGWTAR